MHNPKHILATLTILAALALPAATSTLAVPATAPAATAHPTTHVIAPASKRTGAVCKDGTRTIVTGRGACSRHHRVAHWLYSGK